MGDIMSSEATSRLGDGTNVITLVTYMFDDMIFEFLTSILGMRHHEMG